jgi:hypothetical protein
MVPSLFFEISKCKNFLKFIFSEESNKSCHDILEFQKTKGAIKIEDFQIPEPWSGDIINAPILVLSSNPAYSISEIYPNSTWPRAMIADFFINRFKNRGEIYSWVYKKKVLNKDGTRGQSVRYWSSINMRIEEILGYTPTPGVDYCMTEIVHCKSSHEIGVTKALSECSSNFLDKKIAISGAKLIVSIGSFIENVFNKKTDISGIPILYLPHPNAFKPKKISNHYSNEEVMRFRNILNSDNKSRNIDYSDVTMPTEDEVKKFIGGLIAGDGRNRTHGH